MTIGLFSRVILRVSGLNIESGLCLERFSLNYSACHIGLTPNWKVEHLEHPEQV